MTERSSDQRNRGGRGSGSRPLATPPPGRARRAAPEPLRYTMADLEHETGLTARTIRYYISQGLLPPAHGRGPTATYDLGHLLRLRMIGQLKEEYLPLNQIKQRLGDLTDEDIAAQLAIQTRPPEDRWRRILLNEDIELHIRERSGRERDLGLEQAVDEIIELTRPVMAELERRG